MLSAIRTAPQNALAPAPAVVSPHAPHSQAAHAVADGVTLSAPPAAEPAPQAVETGGTEGHGRKAAIVAAGLTAAVLAGVLGPLVGNVLTTVPVDVASQVVSVPVPGGATDSSIMLAGAGSRAAAPVGSSQDTVDTKQATAADPSQNLAELVGQMGGVAEQSAKLLPQANGVHDQWSKDLTAMQATAKDVAGHVDALMRDSKTYSAAHHTAINTGLARLAQQTADLQERVGREQPVVDQFLGSNRDNLNQIGTVSFNLESNINQAASKYGYFSTQRQGLRQLGKEVHQSTVDLAVSTEKATSARALDKALLENLKAVQQLVGQTQKAMDAAAKSGKLDTVDAGVRTLENAAKVLGNGVDQSRKAVQESAARAQAGADDLAVVYHTLGGQAPPTSAQPAQ